MNVLIFTTLASDFKEYENIKIIEDDKHYIITTKDNNYLDMYSKKSFEKQEIKGSENSIALVQTSIF